MPSRDLVVAAAGASAPSDPNFENVTLLLNGDGTNGSQNNTFLDSSTNNFTITRNGNTTQGTFSPYGNLWSNYFDGSGDWLNTGSNAALAMGTGDFTWECYVYVNASGGYQTLIDSRSAAGGYNDGYFFGFTTGALTLSVVKGAVVLTSTTSVVANSWNHAALVRSAGTITIYINGVASGSIADSTNLSYTKIGIGSLPDSSVNNFAGYISNARIVKGTAVYTANFTPPSLANLATSGSASAACYPSTTNVNTSFAASATSLLTCQSNRFIDNSSNNFTLTVNGDVKVTKFSPFNPTAAYSASTIGGSGYFDGTGDYLSGTTNSSFPTGSSAYTIEMWVYQTYSKQGDVVSWGTATNNQINALTINTNGSVTNFWWFNDLSTPAGAVKYNSWTHIVAQYNGTTRSIYINGVLAASDNPTAPNVAANTAFYVASNNANTFNGYISNLRIVKGTAIYTGNFTPPTLAPLAATGSSSAACYPSTTNVNTSFTNTSLLLNFTNAGIQDLSMQNNLETVGNARVSTSVKKYGTGSLYFDGSGDGLQLPITPQLYLGTTYTIEAWIYPSTVSDWQPVFSMTEAFTGGFTELGIYRNNTSIRAVLRTTTNGSTTVIEAGTVSINTWYHVALSVNATSAKLFLNGTQIGSTTTFAEYPIAKTTYAAVGAWGNGFTAAGYGPWNGYIDDLRITKGYARYPTEPFPTAALPTY